MTGCAEQKVPGKDNYARHEISHATSSFLTLAHPLSCLYFNYVRSCNIPRVEEERLREH